MDYELRGVIEKVAVETQTVVKRNTFEVYEVVSPTSRLELGPRHTAQLSLLQKIQWSKFYRLSNRCWVGSDSIIG